MNKKQIQIGKTLCYHLRHNLVNFNHDSAGYVSVDELIDKKIINCSIDELKFIIDNNDKQRLKLQKTVDKYYIRANQGHSLENAELINNEDIFEEILEPENLVHGMRLFLIC
jgi:2'-phosphotransferase